ncbi:MAG: helix-turn-helix domain-containing protein [Sporolactobacillus sp.]
MDREIGPNAKRIRGEKGITLSFVSRKLGYLSPSSWADIENGRRRLDADKVPILADALGVSVEQLFFNKDDRDKRTFDHQKQEAG